MIAAGLDAGMMQAASLAVLVLLFGFLVFIIDVLGED